MSEWALSAPPLRTNPRHAPIAMRLYLASIFFFLRFIFIVHSAKAETVEDVAVHDATTVASGSAHTNNWAVLVCASRYWFNYRVRSIDLLHAFRAS